MPVMAMAETTVDYGTVHQNSERVRLFTIANIGTGPLVISHARSSCGCLVVSSPKEPILPGMTAQLSVRYDTGRVGPFTKTVAFRTNEADEGASHRLTVTGTVLAKASPDSVPEPAPGPVL
jgi:hypothetical protein